MKILNIAMLSMIALSTTNVNAAPVWQDFSITGLYGTNYELVADPSGKQTTFTFEYAAKVKYADFFAFADRTESNGVKATYAEISPRLSLKETTGLNFGNGLVKDVLVSTTWEAGDGFNNYLYGVGVDLNIPKFQYASLNFYRANNENVQDDWQITATYGVPFKLANEDFLFDGFLDWSTKEDDHAAEMNWTNQLKWNVGKHISPNTRLYVGLEHSLWQNKYGVKNADENNVSALVKYHF